eukprot:PhF_6_TR36359/c0_g1_i2/m.53349
MKGLEKITDVKNKSPLRPAIALFKPDLFLSCTQAGITETYFSDLLKATTSENQCKAITALADKVATKDVKSTSSSNVVIPHDHATMIIDVVVQLLFDLNSRHMHKFIVLMLDRWCGSKPELHSHSQTKFSGLLLAYLDSTSVVTFQSYDDSLQFFNVVDCCFSHCKPFFLPCLVSSFSKLLNCVARGIQFTMDACLGRDESVPVSTAMSHMRFVLRVVANMFTRSVTEVAVVKQSPASWQHLGPICQILGEIGTRQDVFPKDMLNGVGLILSSLLPPWTAVTSTGIERSPAVAEEVVKKAVMHEDKHCAQQWTDSFDVLGRLCVMKGCFLRLGVSVDSVLYSEALFLFSTNREIAISTRFYALQGVETLMEHLKKASPELVKRLLLPQAAQALMNVLFEFWEDSEGISSKMLEGLFDDLCCVCSAVYGDLFLITPQRVVKEIPWSHRCKYPSMHVIASHYGVASLFAQEPNLIALVVKNMAHVKVASVAGDFLLMLVKANLDAYMPVLMKSFQELSSQGDNMVANSVLTHVAAPLCKEKPELIEKFLDMLRDNVASVILLLRRLRSISVLSDNVDRIVNGDSFSDVLDKALVHSDTVVRNNALEVVLLQKKVIPNQLVLHNYLSRNVKTGDTAYRAVMMVLLQKLQQKYPSGDTTILKCLLRLCYAGCPLDRRVMIYEYWLWYLLTFGATPDATPAHMIGPLLTSFTEGWERVRSIACEILVRYPNLIGSIDAARLKAWAIDCVDCPKRKVSESGCLTLFLLAKDFTDAEKLAFVESFHNRLKARSSENRSKYPLMNIGVHGTLMTLRLVLTKWASEGDLFKDAIPCIVEDVREVLRAATGLVTSCEGTDDGEAAVNVDCRGHVILGNVGAMEQRKIVSCAWLAVKDASELLESLVATALRHLTAETCHSIGTECMQTLLRTKHNGVMSKARHALLVLCHHTLRHPSSAYFGLASSFMQDLLGDEGVQCSRLDRILRRSQGLPPAVTALLEAEDPNLPRKVFPVCAEVLLGVLENESSPLEHKINALNVLRYVLEACSLNKPMAGYVERLLLVVLKGIQHPAWSMRNSCVMVHSQLVSRIAGDHTTHRSVTFQDARTKYPVAMRYLLHEINTTKDGDVYLLMLLFSLLIPNPSAPLDPSTLTLLQNIVKKSNSKECLVRQMVSEAIVTLLCEGYAVDVKRHLLSTLKSTTANNEMHGILLCLLKVDEYFPLSLEEVQSTIGEADLLRLMTFNPHHGRIAPLVCARAVQLCRRITIKYSTANFLRSEIVSVATNALITANIVVAKDNTVCRAPGFEDLLSEACRTLFELKPFGLSISSYLTHPFVHRWAMLVFSECPRDTQCFFLEDVEFRSNLYSFSTTPRVLDVLLTYFTTSSQGFLIADASLPSFSVFSNNVLAVLNGTVKEEYITICPALPLAAVIHTTLPSFIDMSQIVSICDIWTGVDQPLEYRKAVASTLRYVVPWKQSNPTHRRTLCEVVVRLLYDEEDVVRDMMSDVILEGAPGQVELAIETFFVAIATNPDTLSPKDIVELCVNTCAPEICNDDVIFDVEAPNYYMEHVHVVQYYLSLLRYMLQNATPTTQSGVKSIAEEAITQSLLKAQRLARDIPFGSPSDWPHAWAAIFTCVGLAWAIQSTQLHTIRKMFGVTEDVMRMQEDTSSLDALFLLSPGYIRKLNL